MLRCWILLGEAVSLSSSRSRERRSSIRTFEHEHEQRATNEEDWIKIDLHIHTLDDPKDAVDFSAHQLLERARSLGFRVLAITLHDAVFDRKEVFADAAAMGILLIPAAEVRLLWRGRDRAECDRGRSRAVKKFR